MGIAIRRALKDSRGEKRGRRRRKNSFLHLSLLFFTFLLFSSLFTFYPTLNKRPNVVGWLQQKIELCDQKNGRMRERGEGGHRCLHATIRDVYTFLYMFRCLSSKERGRKRERERGREGKTNAT